MAALFRGNRAFADWYFPCPSSGVAGRKHASPAPARRARSFALHLPVRYRAGNRGPWRLAVTERVSVREIVIQDRRPPTATSGALVVEVALPGTHGFSGGCLVASGHLKHSRRRSPGFRRPAFAVSIVESRLRNSAREFAEAVPA